MTYIQTIDQAKMFIVVSFVHLVLRTSLVTEEQYLKQLHKNNLGQRRLTLI